MTVYEITAEIERDLCESFERFMCEVHIPDLLHTGYFESAEISVITEGRYRVRYTARTEEVLNEYLENDAARLRADFIGHFPAGVRVSRNTLKVIRIWNS